MTEAEIKQIRAIFKEELEASKKPEANKIKNMTKETVLNYGHNLLFDVVKGGPAGLIKAALLGIVVWLISHAMLSLILIIASAIISFAVFTACKKFNLIEKISSMVSKKAITIEVE